MSVVMILGMIVFGLIGLLLTAFGVLGLASPRRELAYSDRELLWITLAGIGDIVAAALLFGSVF